MFGISGEYSEIMRTNDGIIKRQTFTSEWRTKGDERCKVKVRFDDQCGNGRETFAIIGETQDNINGRWREGSCGCIHDTLREHFPEIAHLIKWHLVSTDGPMYYIENTVYHAGDRDYNGLRKGAQKPLLRGGRAGAFCYEWRTDDNKKLYEIGDPTPEDGETIMLHKRKQMIEGKGKEHDLDAARSCAVWPDATDEELSQDKEDLTRALLARLPALMSSFHNDMIAAGLTSTRCDWCNCRVHPDDVRRVGDKIQCLECNDHMADCATAEEG